MSVRQFEDERWRTTDQKTEFRHRACVDLVSEGPVLDVGCGDGLLLRMLRDKGIVASGVDISAEGVAKCRAAGFEAVEHTLDDLLPFADNSFDTVVMLDILEHVYDPLPALLEARRVARTAVIVGVPNFSSLPARLQVLMGKVPENNRPGKGHIYWFNHPILLDLAAKAGLTVGEKRMNTFSILTRLGTSAQRLAPNLFALSFVIRFTKD